MNGMEMLVQSLLKSSGVEPEKVKADIQNFGRNLEAKISSMDASMQAIRNDIEGLRAGQVTISELLLELSRATTRPAPLNGAGK